MNLLHMSVGFLLFYFVSCQDAPVQTDSQDSQTFNVDINEDWDGKNSSDPLVLQMRFYEKMMLDVISGTGPTGMNMYEKLQSYNLSASCMSSGAFMFDAITNFEHWALKSKYTLYYHHYIITTKPSYLYILPLPLRNSG